MKVIGITGGVGSGKSALLSYVKNKYDCKVIFADEAAHQVKEPGQPCYEQLLELMGRDILNGDGTINKERMAAKIFGKKRLLEQVNAIIHPAVKQLILKEIAMAEAAGKPDFLFIEAALLIEDGYLEIVDEMWYIYAGEDVRRNRLVASRNYTEQKIDSIMESQLSEKEFRKRCSIVIDNSGSLDEAFQQIDRKLGEYL